MKPAPFRYVKARSVAHAVELLSAHAEARLLAGGQSLVPAMNMRLASPPVLVDINGIAGLAGIARRDGMIEIGALVRHVQAERSDTIAAAAPLLARALPHVAHPAIRNRGTLGGSIALADPAAELPACLLALGGEVDVTGPLGPRTIAADDLFKGLFETAIGPHDMLTAIRLPAAAAGRRAGFAEFARRHGDYALVGLAATARADGAGLADVRLAFFGVDNRPTRASHAEAALAHGPVDDARLDAAVAALGRDLAPADDVQASAAARRHMAGVLLRRVARQLTEAQ